jgi:hypothetical protein
VLSLVDGESDLRRIALELAISEFDVARTIYGMIATGLIVVAGSDGGRANA